ncbi:hypothetical protein WKI65_36935 [Streptomyces sp. MS1.AVA.3]|uniref:cyanobactin maturation protease PatG family protein n=1 Tax=Streptomyces decoyicus TaxID=249567 RepID=UPI0030BF2E0F
MIYAIGTIGFDFQTEARRDSFRQQMPNIVVPATGSEPEKEVQPNIYDPRQLHAYLSKNPWASDKLTWTLNMDATPLYALEAEMPVGMDWTRPIITDPKASSEDVEQLAQGAAGDSGKLAQLLETLSYPPVSCVYRTFRDAILGQARSKDESDYISRVSVPGVLTDRTARLYSGQVLPVVEVKSRGLFTWNEALLVKAVFDAVVEKRVQEARKAAVESHQDPDAAEAKVRKEFAGEKGTFLRKSMHALLHKVYWQFRNLGQSSRDRALNAAGTNAFLVGHEIQDGVLSASGPVGRPADALPGAGGRPHPRGSQGPGRPERRRRRGRLRLAAASGHEGDRRLLQVRGRVAAAGFSAAVGEVLKGRRHERKVRSEHRGLRRAAQPPLAGDGRASLGHVPALPEGGARLHVRGQGGSQEGQGGLPDGGAPAQVHLRFRRLGPVRHGRPGRPGLELPAG